jgi:hypothetical protein
MTVLTNCVAACDAKYAAGAKALRAVNARSIACTCAPNVCGSACGDTWLCKHGGSEMNKSCDDCTQGDAGRACNDQELSTCAADPDCASEMACYGACEKTDPAK